MDERIKTSLAPLHAQISAPTEMMDRIIQKNLTTESTTVSTRGLSLQHESPYNEEPGLSRFPTVAPPTTAVYSSDMVTGATRITHRRRPPQPQPQNAEMDTVDKIVFHRRNRWGEYSQTHIRHDRAVWEHHRCNHNAAV